MSMFLFRNLLVLYLGTFIKFVYLRFIKRSFKELLHPAQEGKIDKDNELDIFTNEMANRSYGYLRENEVFSKRFLLPLCF